MYGTVGEIHNHLVVPLEHETLALVLEQLRPLADRQFSAQVEDRNRVNDAFSDCHGACQPTLTSAAALCRMEHCRDVT
jgi:hypothetical protein